MFNSYLEQLKKQNDQINQLNQRTYGDLMKQNNQFSQLNQRTYEELMNQNNQFSKLNQKTFEEQLMQEQKIYQMLLGNNQGLYGMDTLNQNNNMYDSNLQNNYMGGLSGLGGLGILGGMMGGYDNIGAFGMGMNANRMGNTYGSQGQTCEKKVDVNNAQVNNQKSEINRFPEPSKQSTYSAPDQGNRYQSGTQKNNNTSSFNNFGRPQPNLNDNNIKSNFSNSNSGINRNDSINRNLGGNMPEQQTNYNLNNEQMNNIYSNNQPMQVNNQNYQMYNNNLNMNVNDQSYQNEVPQNSFNNNYQPQPNPIEQKSFGSNNLNTFSQNSFHMQEPYPGSVQNSYGGNLVNQGNIQPSSGNVNYSQQNVVSGLNNNSQNPPQNIKSQVNNLAAELKQRNKQKNIEI